MSEEEKEAKREYGKNRYRNMKENASQKSVRETKYQFFIQYKMSKKTLKCDNVEVNKKEFHASKQTIPLNLLNVNQILISVKFDHSDKVFKYFSGYKDDDMIRALCIILP